MAEDDDQLRQAQEDSARKDRTIAELQDDLDELEDEVKRQREKAEKQPTDASPPSDQDSQLMIMQQQIDAMREQLRQQYVFEQETRKRIRPQEDESSSAGSRCGGTTKSLTAGSDATAAVDTYSAATDEATVSVDLATRVFWDGATLWLFTRTFHFAACTVSAESRVDIDDPEDCP